jgi:hypothetical protein
MMASLCALAQTPSVPENLLPRDGAKLILHAHATGDQIYACQATPGGSSYAWVLSAPDAKLFDGKGAEIGKHFAGPTWESRDGSQVKGIVMAQASPAADSIPWLLLTATDHGGAGVLSEVTNIQRLETHGGKAPATGCDASHAGEKTRVSYSAEYYFYGPEN